MPRDLPLSNGRFLINFDSGYSIRDIYFPHVGKENHAFRCRSRLGVWVDGDFSWVDSEGWRRTMRYAEDTLVTDVTAVHPDLELELHCEDAVDFDLNVLIRRLTVHNHASRPREVRLFLHLDVALGGNAVGDTAFLHPDYGAIIAYKDVHYLLLSARTAEHEGLDAWSTGHKDPEDGRGSWRDAEDGTLDGAPVAFGSVDFVGGLFLGTLPAGASATAYAWLAAGTSIDEVIQLHERVLSRNPGTLIERTRDYWRAWVHKEAKTSAGLSRLPDSVQRLYRRSLMIVRAQSDNDGAIIAAADSDVSGPFTPNPGAADIALSDPFHGHEDYAYSWPRDGALAACALDRSGYSDIARRYLAFCARNMTQDPERGHSYMLQKYMANGSVASNVIPWVDARGQHRLPIQEDETALVLIAFANHYRTTRGWEFMAPLYRPLVKEMANFMVDYRDERTGLPLPSQDLWEERDGVHAFTVATVWRALQDAAFFTRMFGDSDLTERYERAADEIKQGTERELYDEASGRFARSVILADGGGTERDMVVDASLWALAYFGMFAPDDERIVRTMEAVRTRLAVPGPHGGLARFEGDGYQLRRSGADAGVPGNPWFLCSLWLAQYEIQSATSAAQLKQPLSTLEWVAEHALPSGLLAEQIDPLTGEPASATPLTWAHATFILTVLEYLEARAKLA